MFDPDGYLPVHDIVALVASWGAQGKLPRNLGFVHPGDSAEFDDLPADAVARHVLGEKMAAGTLPFIVIVFPSGDIYAGSAHYWRADGSYETMKDSRMDPRVLGLDAGLNSARVLLHPAAVAAALGMRLVPPDESVAPIPEPPDEPAAPTPTPPEARPTARRGRSYQGADEPLIAEMHARIMAGSDTSARSAARTVVHKATGNGSDDSKVERLANLYRQTHRSLE
jgi:hypothetical protein